MQYDVWNNMTSKSGRLWRGSLSDSGTYINNRRQFWSYDAEGNVLGNDGKVHTYDAVGKQTHVMSAMEIVGGSGTGHPQQSGWEIAQSYDVGGKTARRIETRRTEEPIGEGPETNITETVTTTFYLYSSVLGAKVVELDAAGVKTKGFVYANGERLAKQEINTVWWSHPNRGTNSWVEVYEGGVLRQEMDPMGAEVGIHDPYLDPGQPLYKDIQQLPQQLYIEGGNPFDYSGGYELDGMPVSASELRRRMESGSVGVGYLIRDSHGLRTVQGQIASLGLGIFIRQYPRPHNEGWHEDWGEQVLYVRDPQNTGEKPFSSSDLKGIRDRLAKILSKDCREFLDKLLTQAGGTEDIAVTTDMLLLFDRVSKQQGIVSAGLDRDGRTYSSVKGAVGAPGGAKVLLSSTSDLYSPKTRILYHAFNALSELTHVAGHKPSSYATGAFSDYNLGKVAYDVAKQMGYNTTPPPSIDPRNDPFGRWSDYYHTIAKQFCKRD